jgi:phytoene dehydrogenase-like protein
LLGSDPKATMYSQWREVFDIGKLTFVYPEEYVRLETEHGEPLSIYSNVERMEAELLSKAPQDAAEIRRFASAIRKFGKLTLPDLTEPWPRNWLTMLRVLPNLPLLRRWSGLTSEEYGQRFNHPSLRRLFGEGDMAQLSVLALVASLAWMSGHQAGYPIGGSQAVIQGIVETIDKLGGRLRLGAKVERILVERSAAVGVQLTGGEAIAANWVISAADGHATIYNLLGGQYKDNAIDRIYAGLKTVPS